MTASNSAQAAARANEPSMEEILASIRKIIAEDQRPPAAEETVAEPIVAAPAMNDDADEDVLDLVAPVAAPTPDVTPAATARIAPTSASAKPVSSTGSLVSDTTAEVTGAAFQSLANAVFTQNARTMDDLVKDMLRPMLKAWLDENLPTLVERLVRAEIERVARGGR